MSNLFHKLTDNRDYDRECANGGQQKINKSVSFHSNSQNSMSSFEVISKSEKEDEKLEVDNLRGIIYMIIAKSSATLMLIMCKMAYQANPYLNGFDYVICRATTMTSLSIFQVVSSKVNPIDIKKGYRMALFVRCLAGGIGMPCYFMSLKYIPASKGSLIFNIHPMLVSIVAFFLLGERLTKLKVIAVIGAFAGASIFSYHKNTTVDQEDNYFLGIALVS